MCTQALRQRKAYPVLEGYAIKQERRMEIRPPALHSALGRGLLCLSPPPSPQLLSSYSISTIWCLLMAVFSLQAPYSSSGHPCTVCPSKHCSSHPSSPSNLIPSQSLHPPLCSIPVLPSHTRHSQFPLHCLGSISSFTSDSFPIMIPLPLLLSFPFFAGLVLQIHSPLPSLSLYSD